jgi:predicted RND superfamily exporter protein
LLGSRIRVDSAVLDQFDPADELYVTTRLIEERLAGVRPLEVYVLAETPQRLADPEVLDALDRVAAQARDLPGVIGTMSWSNYLREARVMVTGEPASRVTPFAGTDDATRYGALLSAGDFDPTRAWVNTDRTRLRLSVQLRDVGARATIDVARALEAALQVELQGLGDVRFVLTGDAYASSIGLRAVIGDLGSSLGLAVLIIFAFITLLFRSPRLGLVSVPPNLTPLVLTLAWMAASGIPLNAATVIIFSVSIGMGVDGTIHIFARVGEELRKGLDVPEALLAAARGTGRAIVLTNLSLLLGFGVMLLSAFVPVQRFGMLVGVTMFAGTFSTVIVLPALLTLVLPRPTARRLQEATTSVVDGS